MSSIMNSDGDNNNSDIPQWKKDLIARLRNQNRRTANCGGILVERYQQQQQQQQQHSPQSSASMVAVINAESSSTPSSSSSSSSIQHNNQYESVCRSSKNKVNSECVIKSCKTMVQDCVIYDNNWENFEDHQHKHHHQYKNGNSRDYYGDHCTSSDDNKDVDDDDDDDGNNDSDKNSIDDLHYGPGIVNKLKNKYLSLVLRESIKNNNSGNIKRLPMRKAASLENILDDCNDDDNNKHGKLSNNNSNNNTESLYKKFNNKNDLNKVNCRYRKTTRGNDNNNKKIIVKRARSVETISRHNHEIDDIEKQPQQLNKQRESMPEEILIKFNNNQDLLEQKCVDNNHKSSSSSSSNMVTPRINRPKRIQPVVNEKEKPPVDFVKQTKLIFERHRPELYKKSSSSTGNNTNNNNNNEVATKVANYKNIVNNNKNNKNKPPIKQKPVLLKINEKSPRKSKNHQDHDGGDNDDRKVKISPPDVSQLNDIKTNQLSSNTPDLIITSSPVSSSPISVFYHLKQATETFLQEEIRNNFVNNPLEINSIESDEVKNQIDGNEVEDSLEKSEDDCGGSLKKVSPQAMINIDKVSTTIMYNFIKTNKTTENHLAPTTMDLNEKKTPINQPLKLDTTLTTTTTTTITSTASPKIIEKINKLVSPPLRSSSSSSVSTSKPAPVLTMLEIEKNMKNTVKTLEQPKSIVSSINNNNNNSNNIDNNSANCLQKVPKLVKRKPPANKQQSDNNSIVFKFTDRKDVPDYLHHDGLIRVGKIERPKVGEGGIILLPGASIEESFTDDDVDEIMRSLEAPPSPCDVTFINDNILIDGKSSLITQKTRKNNNSSSKLKISFVDDGPEVYEYPSESSFSIEDQQQQISGHTTVLPSLSGSSLGNYTPKSTEEFHPGVTRTCPITPTSCTSNNDNKNSNETVLQETEKPIVFSAGTNSDILF